MEKKKIIIAVGVVAVLGVAYYMMKKKKGVVITETTTTSVNPTELTRTQITDAIFEENKARLKEGETKAIYDRFNDADLKMIYDVDVKKIPVTPEYITMLKKYGWA